MAQKWYKIMGFWEKNGIGKNGKPIKHWTCPQQGEYFSKFLMEMLQKHGNRISWSFSKCPGRIKRANAAPPAYYLQASPWDQE